jgi:UMF1 family MFS transporter
MMYPAKGVYSISPWLVFPFGGIVFFLFSLPMFINIPERIPFKEETITWKLIRKEIYSLKQLIHRLKKEPNLRNAFLANFLAVDAVNTALLFFTTFLLNAIFYNMDEDARVAATTNQMLALTLTAIVMSMVFGWLADYIGSKRAFLLAVLAMGSAALCGCLLPRGYTFYISVTLFGGAGLAGVWTAGRKLFADITPVGQEGDIFGLYGMANKSSALGTILFACITFFLPGMGIMSEPRAYRTAFLFTLVPLGISLYFLRKIKLVQTKEELQREGM